MDDYTFIIWDRDGHRYTEDIKASSEDNAWDMIRTYYPDADYIELY